MLRLPFRRGHPTWDTTIGRAFSATLSVMAKRMLSDEHKAAIAAGRVETAAVSGYLEALEAQRPKRGRQVTPERLEARIAEIDAQLTSDPKPMKRLALMQDRRDVEAQLAALADEPDMTAVEAAFIEHAASFASRRGIAYATWREAGVPADMLGRAGIARGQ